MPQIPGLVWDDEPRKIPGLTWDDEEKEKEEEIPWYHKWIGTGLEVVPSIGGSLLGGGAGLIGGAGVGSIPGAMAGGAAGSAVGNTLRQMYEGYFGLRDEFNPWELGGSTLLGAAPPIFGPGKLAAKAGLSGIAKYAGKAAASGGLEGAIYGAAGVPIQKWAQNGDITPTWGELGQGAEMGGLFGAATGGLLGAHQARGHSKALEAIANADTPFGPTATPFGPEAPPPPPPTPPSYPPEGLQQIDLLAGVPPDIMGTQQQLPFPQRNREAGDREVNWLDEPYLDYKEGPQQQGLGIDPIGGAPGSDVGTLPLPGMGPSFAGGAASATQPTTPAPASTPEVRRPAPAQSAAEVVPFDEGKGLTVPKEELTGSLVAQYFKDGWKLVQRGPNGEGIFKRFFKETEGSSNWDDWVIAWLIKKIQRRGGRGTPEEVEQLRQRIPVIPGEGEPVPVIPDVEEAGMMDADTARSFIKDATDAVAYWKRRQQEFQQAGDKDGINIAINNGSQATTTLRTLLERTGTLNPTVPPSDQQLATEKASRDEQRRKNDLVKPLWQVIIQDPSANTFNQASQIIRNTQDPDTINEHVEALREWVTERTGPDDFDAAEMLSELLEEAIDHQRAIIGEGVNPPDPRQSFQQFNDDLFGPQPDVPPQDKWDEPTSHEQWVASLWERARAVGLNPEDYRSVGELADAVEKAEGRDLPPRYPEAEDSGYDPNDPFAPKPSTVLPGETTGRVAPFTSSATQNQVNQIHSIIDGIVSETDSAKVLGYIEQFRRKLEESQASGNTNAVNLFSSLIDLANKRYTDLLDELYPESGVSHQGGPYGSEQNPSGGIPPQGPGDIAIPPGGGIDVSQMHTQGVLGGGIPGQQMLGPRGEADLSIDAPVPPMRGQQELPLGPHGELIPRELPEDAMFAHQTDWVTEAKMREDYDNLVRDGSIDPNRESFEQYLQTMLGDEGYSNLRRTGLEPQQAYLPEIGDAIVNRYLKQEDAIPPEMNDIVMPPEGGVPPDIAEDSGAPPPPPTVPPQQPPQGPPPEDPFDVDKYLAEQEAREKPSRLREWYDLARGLTTTLDFSAPLRQGLPLIFTKEWRQSWSQMMKSWGSEGAYQKTLADIRSRELFRPKRNVKTKKIIKSWADQAGLRIMDLGQLTAREEALAGTWVESGGMVAKIPGAQKAYQATLGRGARASNRAYTAFLNQLRADTFENLLKAAKSDFDAGIKGARDPYNDLPFAQEIAAYVNTATGRGPLKTNIAGKEINLEQYAKGLGDLIFSPRLMASRVRMLNPSTYTMASPFVRKQYLKSLINVAGAWGAFAATAKMMGAEVETDLRSADFGKARIGNTRLDAGGGFQQYLVAGARLLTGKTISSGRSTAERTLGEGYRADTRKDIIERFGVNKLHPVMKFAYDLVNASEYQPFQVVDRTTQMFVPLIVQDVWELAKKDPSLLPLIIPPVAAGMGTQTYERGEAISKFLPPEYDINWQGGTLWDSEPSGEETYYPR